MNDYTDTIRRWATDTRRTGVIDNADGIGEVGLESAVAGKRLAARFTLRVELDRVADARYQVFGCGFSMAACAVAADLAVGYPIDDLHKIDTVALDQALDGLPAERSYCAELAVEALQAAVTSVSQARETVFTSLRPEPEHQARASAHDPVYRALLATPRPDMVAKEDRHLFACLISVAARESYHLARMLGLEETDLEALLCLCFPGMPYELLIQLATNEPGDAPRCNAEVLKIILAHVPRHAGFNQLQVSIWLARILATRSSLPGHLWVAMGLTERPQLSAAIRRHLPSLADANSEKMRWKRYLYKQVCELNGGVMCKTPDCSTCSDYHLCFAEEE